METIQRKKIKIKNLFMCRRIISVSVIFILIILLFKWIFTSIIYDAKCCQIKKLRKIWPEDLPDGDRIKEQMYYVPKGYEYDKTPIKQILVHTGKGLHWENFKLNQGEFIGCPVSQCWLTIDKSLGSEVDAVFFRHTFNKPEHKRPPNQIWIMEFTEPPPKTSPLGTEAIDVFNWTVSYRLDSDIPIPYGYFMKKTPLISQLPKHVDFPKTKTKKVAWFVSDCNTHSKREVYVKELAKYIDVDIYGRCGNLKCPQQNETKEDCLMMVEQDYKFYLSFENSRCRHYITEKFYTNALNYYVVPIVMGPSRDEYEMVAPKNSFIHVDDFGSPEQLAAYLHELDKNDELYEEYFQWKHTGTVIPGMHSTRLYCRLCAMLHDPNPPVKHYEDIDKWWRGDGICTPNVRPHL